MLDKILKCTLVFTFIILTLTILLQVLARYVASITIPWTEEGARLILIIVTFLGTAIALKSDEHISLFFLFKKIPDRYKNYVTIVINLIIILFLLFFIKGSLEMISMNWVVPLISLPKLRVGYVYLILPISSFLMIYFLILKIRSDIHLIRKRKYSSE